MTELIEIFQLLEHDLPADAAAHILLLLERNVFEVMVLVVVVVN